MNTLTNYIVTTILIVMFVLLLTSAWGESATMDELAHIPSGYSYLSQQDFRLNPEHPPLIKDLSAFPLLFLNLNFPTNVPAWTEYINGQWDMGRIFIYESGNDADKIIKYSRFPIMLLAILFGLMLFKWVKGLYGNKVALLTLFLFAFSPTFLAHSRYVTTDLAAAFGFFIGIAAFLNFLNKYNTEKEKKYLILAGVAFGIAQLLKFSLVILAPLYVIFGGLWVFLNHYKNFVWKKFLIAELKMMGKIILIGLVSIAIIWPVYMFHVWNMPIEKQVSDTEFILKTFRVRFLADFTVWLSNTPVLRAMGQYILGILMVLQRAAGGNTTYFVGQISSSGWFYYFPLLYLLKEHLAFHLLTIITIIFGIKNIVRSKEKNLQGAIEWMRENFVLTASFIFIGIYWLQAMTSPLNIGVRHVLPTFPFIYLLVSKQAICWIKRCTTETATTFSEWVKNIYKAFVTPTKRTLILSLLLFWMLIALFVNFPFFLSYYNGLAGGTTHGYKIATDSNYDWGQDFKKLKSWTDKNLSADERIAIDYFGGSNPRYYFGEKFEPWWSSRGKLNPATGDPEWLAISLTFLMGTQARPVHGFIQKPEDTYSWLKDVEPVARAGTSIFIYKF